MKHKSFTRFIMRQKLLLSLILLLALGLWMPHVARAQNLVVNGSFETLSTSVSSDAYTVNFGSLPTNVATGWALGTSGVNNGYDGIATTSGALGNKVIEDGSHGIFLQGAGSLSQTVTLAAGVYTLSFYAMGRDTSTGGNGVNPVAVTLGSLVSQTVTPANTAQNNLSDWIFYSYNFTVTTSGAYVLKFLGTLPYGTSGDHTTYIDNVSVVASALTAPAVTIQPAPKTLYAGATAQFTVSASGTIPLSYQWRKDGAGLRDGGKIFGATSNLLTITNIAMADASNYDVVITNVSGAVTSSAAGLTLVLPQAAYELAVLTNGPVAYYRLNETVDPSSGTALAFDYAGGFNGVYGNVVQNAFDGITGPVPVEGFSGFESTNGAAQFANGYAASEVTVNPWSLNTNTVTPTAWIDPSGPQAEFEGLVFCRGGGDGSGFNYTGSTDGSGNYTLGYTWNNDGNTWSWNSGLVPPQNQWSLVALTVTPSSATIYLLNTNGFVSATHSYTHGIASFFAPSTIGQDPYSPSRAFNGKIDEVAIFNRALTENQLVVLYGSAAGVTGFPPLITSEPAAQQTLFVAQNAQFMVRAGGFPSPTYQWQVGTNGVYVNLVNGGRVTGATNATLTISNLSLSDPTNFIVQVSNPAGSTNSTPASLTVLPMPAAGSAQTFVTVINPSFEDPQQSGDVYTSPLGTLNALTGVPGWQFSVSAGDSFSGIVTETGTLMGSPKYIPQGWQAAFIQGTGQFSQSVTFNAAGTYVVRFRAEGRSNGGAGAEPILVMVDGNAIGTFTPAITQWALFMSPPFSVAAGVHIVSFAGTVPYSQSDRTSFVDAVQIVTPAEAFAAMPPTSPVYDIVFVGDSITAGATLANPATQAAPVQCMQSLGQRFNVGMRMSNQGHSGHTTVDWLPSTNPSSDFQLALAAASSLEASQPGQLVFSIMLGANDSAQSGPNGAPVSPANYLQNLQSIVSQFLTNYPSALVFVHYPTWYSTNTENSSVYLSAGLARLQTYFPEIDQLVLNCATTYPGHVFSGDIGQAFINFSNNYLTELTPESGVLGTFYLHPNQTGAIVLGTIWANAIAAPLNFSTNSDYVAWLMSGDMIPGIPGTAFSSTPTNAVISNGAAYGIPNGLIGTLGSGSYSVSADIRNDPALTTMLQSSTNLANWNPQAWLAAPSQIGVPTGFIRYLLQNPTGSGPGEIFYRLVLNLDN